MVASNPTTSCQIDGEKVETVTDFIFLGSQITADGDWSHEIKRRLLLRRKAMTNLDRVLKNRDITLPTKVHLVKTSVCPVVMYGCERKKGECQRTDAFELWCWRRFLRVPWTTRRSNHSVLKEIILNIHWKDWCWSWISKTLAVDSLEKNLMLAKIEGTRRRGRQDKKVGWHHWLNAHKFEKAHGEGQGSLACYSSLGSQGVRHNLVTEEQQQWLVFRIKAAPSTQNKFQERFKH